MDLNEEEIEYSDEEPLFTDSEDEEITRPSLPLDTALEMAMKAKEELNKRLVHTAAIGDYKELLEEDQELQWNASISRTDTQNQFSYCPAIYGIN